MAYVISDDCIACGTCIDECPVEAISEGDIYSINRMYVLTVVLVQMFVRLKQFTRLNNTSYKKCTGCFLRKAAFFISCLHHRLHRWTQVIYIQLNKNSLTTTYCSKGITI